MFAVEISENLEGGWCPEQLRTAECAYAEIVRRLDVSEQAEQHAISLVLLQMISDGCLDTTALVQQCIARLYPLTVKKEMPEIAAVTIKAAAEFAMKNTAE
jgi:hypothetical protein